MERRNQAHIFGGSFLLGGRKSLSQTLGIRIAAEDTRPTIQLQFRLNAEKCSIKAIVLDLIVLN